MTTYTVIMSAQIQTDIEADTLEQAIERCMETYDPVHIVFQGKPDGYHIKTHTFAVHDERSVMLWRSDSSD